MEKLPLPIAIIGAGSWGTAVAVHLANNNHKVILWDRSEQRVKSMQKDLSNEKYLSGITFPKSLSISANLQATVKNSSEVIIAVPSHAFYSILEKIPKPKNGIAWITKGIDPQTNKPLNELISQKWGENYPVAAISGPSFAKEVAKGMPTTIVVASNNTDYLNSLISIIHNHTLRCYPSNDLLGVQLCGTIKNVLAIACGISDGLNYGANAKAALITRGLLEMMNLGLALGAQQETFIGLAGIGDLVLTCTDNQSRNRRFGIKLGQGVSVSAAMKDIGQVVEGSQNAEQIFTIATQNKVDMPICYAVYEILKGIKTPNEAAENLLNRPQPKNLT